MPTPTFEQLIAFAAGDMEPEQARTVAPLVEADPKSAAVVAAYRRVREVLHTDDGAEPSAAALARARAVFVNRSQAADSETVLGRWLTAVDRIIGRLVYDSRVQPALVRSAASESRRNLTFEAADGEVDVQTDRIVSPDPSERWRIMGQIAIRGCTATDVALVERDTHAAVATGRSDDRGGFRLDAEPGSYDLLVRRGEGVIVLGPIALE